MGRPIHDCQQVAAELRKYFGKKLCRTKIPRNIRLAEAPSHGKPVVVYDVRSRGAESYIRLAKELMGRGWPQAATQPASIQQTSTQGSSVEDETNDLANTELKRVNES